MNYILKEDIQFQFTKEDVDRLKKYMKIIEDIKNDIIPYDIISNIQYIIHSSSRDNKGSVDIELTRVDYDTIKSYIEDYINYFQLRSI